MVFTLIVFIVVVAAVLALAQIVAGVIGLHLAYESVRASGGTLVIPSAFGEGFTDPDAADALAKAAKKG